MEKKKPVQSDDKLFVSSASLTQIRKLTLGQTIHINYSNNSEELYQIQLKLNGAANNRIELPVAVGKLLKADVKTVKSELALHVDGEAMESPRRSGRARTGKSALELLGKKKVTPSVKPPPAPNRLSITATELVDLGDQDVEESSSLTQEHEPRGKKITDRQSPIKLPNQKKDGSINSNEQPKIKDKRGSKVGTLPEDKNQMADEEIIKTKRTKAIPQILRDDGDPLPSCEQVSSLEFTSDVTESHIESNLKGNIKLEERIQEKDYTTAEIETRSNDVKMEKEKKEETNQFSNDRIISSQSEISSISSQDKTNVESVQVKDSMAAPATADSSGACISIDSKMDVASEEKNDVAEDNESSRAPDSDIETGSVLAKPEVEKGSKNFVLVRLANGELRKFLMIKAPRGAVPPAPTARPEMSTGHSASAPLETSQEQTPAPVQSVPVQEAPVQSTPVQEAPVQSTPVQEVPVQSVRAPVMGSYTAPIADTPKPERKIFLLKKNDETRNEALMGTNGEQGVEHHPDIIDAGGHSTAAPSFRESATVRRRVRSLLQKHVEDSPSPHEQAVDPRLAKLIDDLQPVDDMNKHVLFISADSSQEDSSRKRFRAVCKYCKVTILNKHDFRKHIKEHPEVEHKPWKCPLCDYRASIKATIRKHINIHSEVKAYSCGECGRGFNFKQKLQQHMKYHRDIRDFYCPQCPLSFHELKTLKNHIAKLHAVANVSQYLKTVKYREPETRHVIYKQQHKEEQQRSQGAKRRVRSDNVLYLEYSAAGDGNSYEDQSQSLTYEERLVQTFTHNLGSKMVEHEAETSTDQDPRDTPHVQQVELIETQELSHEPADVYAAGQEGVLSEETVGAMSHVVAPLSDREDASGDGYRQEGDGYRQEGDGYRQEGDGYQQEGDGTGYQQDSGDAGYEQEEGSVMYQGVKQWGMHANESQVQNNEGVEDYDDRESNARTIILETENGPLRLQMFDNIPSAARPAETQIEIELVPGDAVPPSVQEAVQAVQAIKQEPAEQHAQFEQGYEVGEVEESTMEVSTMMPVAEALQEVHTSGDADTHVVMQASTTPQVVVPAEIQLQYATMKDLPKSRLIGTKKIEADTIRFQEGKPPRETSNAVPGEKRKRVLLDGADTPAYSKMKKVTCMEQVEIGVRPHTRIISSPESIVKFVCRLCEAGPQQLSLAFDLYTKFLNHIFVEHPDVKPFQCQQCTYKCRSKANLISHSKIHQTEKKYACTICGKRFYFKQKLHVHMRVHENSREHTCSMCHHGFNEKSDLNRHFRKVHMRERTVPCDHCGKKFYDRTDLSRHLESHSQSKAYQCKFCNKFYQTKISLSQHVKSHTCIFHCEICSRDFGSYSGFMAHKVMHDESSEGYLCELCDKKIMTKGSMKRHMQICHNEERPYSCQRCRKTYKSKKDLKNHYLTHAEDRVYVCEVCSFTSKRIESLRVHMRIHDPVKPYQCGVCQKEYTQKHALEMHMAVHIEHQYPCEICQRRFPTGALLASHIQAVHGEQPLHAQDNQLFQCDLCQQPFYDSEMLNKHMLQEHVPEELREQVAQSGSMTVYMCEECQCACVSQDALAVHILEQHMGKSGAHAKRLDSSALVESSLERAEQQRRQYYISPVSAAAHPDTVLSNHVAMETNDVECEVVTDTPELTSELPLTTDSHSSLSDTQHALSDAHDTLSDTHTAMEDIAMVTVDAEESVITDPGHGGEFAHSETILGEEGSAQESHDHMEKDFQPVLTTLLKRGPDQIGSDNLKQET